MSDCRELLHVSVHQRASHLFQADTFLVQLPTCLSHAQVVEALLKFSELRDWRAALEHIIPIPA